MVSVAAMKPSEAGAVSDLFREVLLALPYYNDQARAAELQKYSTDRLVLSSKVDARAVLVAHDDNQLVGFCFSDIDDGLIWLAWFGVISSRRRQGIGQALLQSIEMRTREASAHKIWCDCRTGNEASIAALTAHGFRTISTVERHWHGQDYILWEKFVN